MPLPSVTYSQGHSVAYKVFRLRPFVKHLTYWSTSSELHCPGQRQNQETLCRCHRFADYRSSKKKKKRKKEEKKNHCCRSKHNAFASHLLLDTLSVWAESIGQQKLPTRTRFSVSAECLRLDVCHYKSSVTVAALSALCRPADWWGLGAVWEPADCGSDEIKNIKLHTSHNNYILIQHLRIRGGID